jgi:hypothetical protein
MSPFTHIIAEWHVNHWFAWFEDTPNVVSEQPTVIEAIHGLIQVHALSSLCVVRCVTVNDGTASGRTEIRRTVGICPH